MFRRTFQYGYIIDDLEIVKPQSENHPDRFMRIFKHLFPKHYVESRLAHQCSTWVHIVACVLIYIAFGYNGISFATAMLFAFNPVNNQGSIWLSGKPYAMTACLLLLGLIFYPIMPLMFGCAIWLTTTAIFFPFLYLFERPHYYLILLPIVGYFFSKRFRAAIKTRTAGGTDEMVVLKPRKIIIYFKTLGYYFRLCLVPWKNGMCHSYLHTFGLTPDETKMWYTLDKYFFLGVGVMGATIWSFFHLPHPVCYGLIWFTLLTSQYCNILMVNHPITERYL
jgi:hypothetical protein